MPLIEIGHIHFGENKVQEAKQKWSGILSENKSINLHLLGKLQSNKAKEAFKIFNFIHTLDNCKLAKILSSLEKDNVRKINYFVQVNIGNEIQKNGIDYNLATEFIKYCRFDLLLNIIGLMCIPPLGHSSSSYFKKCKKLADLNNLKELSMGMSNDYIEAVKNGSTFVRIGNAIFGERFT
jgi:pyridoxal phosphate enzyme (YggS family)